MGIWRLLIDEGWPLSRTVDLMDSIQKLIRYSQHFQEESHLKLARQTERLLREIEKAGTITENNKDQMTQLMSNFTQLAARRSDEPPTHDKTIAPKKPIYIALNSHSLAQKIERQLDFFGFHSVVFQEISDLIQALNHNRPAVLLVDVNFGHHFHEGLDYIQNHQQNQTHPIPAIFHSKESGDIHTLIKCARANGSFFHSLTIEMSKIVEEIEVLSDNTPPPPYRVLVVEDSKTQAYKIKHILDNAGMDTQAILDPMLILESLEEFQPEIILMDMYMPVCSGVELANVIRQQDKFVSIPIVYLSAEDDIEKQLEAMSKGGDDFLTKPIQPNHLITAVRNKGKRTRQLTALVNQDSLTGLLNHTSILRELDNEIPKSIAENIPLCFAMVDIDHFKGINDNYGHPVGDRVIKSLSMFLKQRLRKTDFIGRYGGEEFAVVLTNTLLRDAVAIFNEIRKRFSQLKQSAGEDKQDFHVTFSCGIVQLDDTNFETITIVCDEVLYDAKKGGRNRVSYRQPL